MCVSDHVLFATVKSTAFLKMVCEMFQCWAAWVISDCLFWLWEDESYFGVDIIFMPV